MLLWWTGCAFDCGASTLFVLFVLFVGGFIVCFLLGCCLLVFACLGLLWVVLGFEFGLDVVLVASLVWLITLRSGPIPFVCVFVLIAFGCDNYVSSVAGWVCLSVSCLLWVAWLCILLLLCAWLFLLFGLVVFMMLLNCVNSVGIN